MGFNDQEKLIQHGEAAGQETTIFGRSFANAVSPKADVLLLISRSVGYDC
ncbi:hypothetical protein [Sphingobium sp.]|nr:hypothetical protein [Sphingobium sp.]